MPNEKLDHIHVGELLRRGFLLNTGEAIALVHEVFSVGEGNNPNRFPQTAEDLWLTKAGELRIAPCAWANAADDPRIAAASLLDTLLPAPSTSPECAVPAPLRSLADRLRASAGAVAGANVRDLLTILRRYVAVDPRSVLQRLAVRASANDARDGAPLLSGCAAEAPPITASDAARSASPAADDALALFGSDTERSSSLPPQSGPNEVAASAAAMGRSDQPHERSPEIPPAQITATPPGRQNTRRARRSPSSESRRSSQPRQARESARDVGPDTPDRRVTGRVRRAPRGGSGRPHAASPPEAPPESTSGASRRDRKGGKSSQRQHPSHTDPILSDALPAAEAVAQQPSPGEGHQEPRSGAPEVFRSAVPTALSAPAVVQTKTAESCDVIFETSNGSQPLALQGDMDVFRRPTVETPAAPHSLADVPTRLAAFARRARS